jgi:hypothetical protein
MNFYNIDNSARDEAVKELITGTRNREFTMNMKFVLFGTAHPVPWMWDTQRPVPLMGVLSCTLRHNCSRGLTREKKYAKFKYYSIMCYSIIKLKPKYLDLECF